MKLQLISTILTIYLCIGSMEDFMVTQKLRKLVYPLIIVYFLVGMGNIERVTDNIVLQFGYVAVGLIITLIFVNWDLMITNREKKYR